MCIGPPRRDVYKKLDNPTERPMTDQTATLFAFPARDDDRLRLALRGLVAALEGQAAAVATLRGELKTLAGTMDGLQGSMHAYRSELGNTAAAVRLANESARTLERTADRWVAHVRV